MADTPLEASQKQVESLKADASQKQLDVVTTAAKNDRFPDTQSFLAVVIIFGVMGLIVLVIFHPPPQEVASTIFTLIGGVVTMAAGVGSFYFGSSKTSSTKDAARDATMTTLVNKVVSNGESTPH